MTRRAKAISLYTGAGGLDYGFEAAGFETTAAVEMDGDSCNTLRRNRDWNVIERSIFDVPSREILAASGLRRGEADVLIGGPPCQPFSKAGYWSSGDALRLDDPRARTLAGYLRVLEDTLPRTFLLENVCGISYSGKSEGVDFLLREIKSINRRTGAKYNPCLRVLKAADYGVPQLRERFFMIGSRDGAPFQFPSPTHRPAEQFDDSALPSYRCAWDALGDLAEPAEEDLSVRGKWANLLPSIPEGHNYLWHTDRGKGMPLFGWRRHFWTFLLKLAKNQPAWTVQAQPGPAIGPFHWNNRRLSMRELCRLQTLPDDVSISGARGAVQRQLGNAVPSLLAEVLAREIRKQLLGLRVNRSRPRLLPPDRSPAPGPEPTSSVPPDYLHLVGDHQAHPGTGKGYAAERRDRALRAELS